MIDLCNYAALDKLRCFRIVAGIGSVGLKARRRMPPVHTLPLTLRS